MHRYGILPLQKIVNDGDGKLIITSLIDITKYLAYKDRSKVCRSLLVLIHLYDNYFTNRIDIGRFILENISKMNNQNVEDFNSLVARIGSKNSQTSFQSLFNDSLLVDINRTIKDAERIQLGRKDITSSKNKGEIKKQENTHLEKRYEKDNAEVKKWLQKHFTKIQKCTPTALSTDMLEKFTEYSIKSSMNIGYMINY